MYDMEKFEHGGGYYAAVRCVGTDFTKLLDFSININPLGLPESVRQAVIGALEEVINYPDPSAKLLKTAVSRRYHVDSSQIVVGNGAAELLYVLCHALRPQRVLIPAPTFSEYERAARSGGAEIQYSYLTQDDGFALKPEKIISQLSKVNLVFLCNPNNPTGRFEPSSELEQIIAAANLHNTLVVVDESFLDLTTAATEFSCKPLLAKYPNLIILQSLTKIYAIPGLRLGVMLADPGLVNQLEKGKDPWNVNTLAQTAGVAALADQQYLEQSIALITAARHTMLSNLKKLNCLTVYPGSANFLLINLGGTGFDANRLGQVLLDQNIIIRNCGNYPGLTADYIRVAVKLDHQNAELLQAFAKLF